MYMYMIIFIALIANLFNPVQAAQTKPEKGTLNLSEKKLEELFTGPGQELEGSLLIKEIGKNNSLVFNEKMTEKMLSPCSTFKIFNSLAALESGVAKDENASRKWKGIKYSIKAWNRDHTLQSAVTNSVVWYFKEVAAEVGEKRMKQYLKNCRYGNEDISSGLTNFWLNKSLKINSRQQVAFISALVKDELPFSKKNTAIVRGMIRAQQTNKGTLYGKTGTDIKDGKLVLGWYVGYLVRPGAVYAFATNLEGKENASGAQAKKITESVLSQMDLL